MKRVIMSEANYSELIREKKKKREKIQEEEMNKKNI